MAARSDEQSLEDSFRSAPSETSLVPSSSSHSAGTSLVPEPVNSRRELDEHVHVGEDSERGRDPSLPVPERGGHLCGCPCSMAWWWPALFDPKRELQRRSEEKEKYKEDWSSRYGAGDYAYEDYVPGVDMATQVSVEDGQRWSQERSQSSWQKRDGQSEENPTVKKSEENPTEKKSEENPTETKSGENPTEKVTWTRTKKLPQRALLKWRDRLDDEARGRSIAEMERVNALNLEPSHKEEKALILFGMDLLYCWM